MGASSVFPARRADADPPFQRELELVSSINSLAPETRLSNPRSLIRERLAEDRFSVLALSGTAGFVDAVGFLTLVGLFPAHMTGELVGLTTALTAGHEMSHPGRFAVIPVFVAALLFAALLTRSRRRRGKSSHRTLLGLMAVALGICTLAGALGLVSGGPESAALLTWREGSIVAAMAFQNAFMREGLQNSCPTTVMTGNLTQCVFELVDSLFTRFGWDRTEDTHCRNVAHSRLMLVGGALGAFLLGAVLGGCLTGAIGAFAIVIPTLATLVLYRRFAPRG